MLSPLASILPGYGYIGGTMYNSTRIPGVLVTTNNINSTTSNAYGFCSLLVGTYNLTATKEPTFYPNSSVIVTAISGTTVMQDIELSKKPSGTIGGMVS